MKCKYTHCKHETREIDGEAVKDGNNYYHPDCYQERKTINEIIDTYIKCVDDTPIMSQLRNVINTIIFTKHVDADFLLYALKNNHARVLHPPGLYYLVKDKEVMLEWERYKATKYLKTANVVTDDVLTTFSYKSPKPKSISDLF